MPFFKVNCVAFPEAVAGAASAWDAVKPSRPATTAPPATPRSANTASAVARPCFMVTWAYGVRGAVVSEGGGAPVPSNGGALDTAAAGAAAFGRGAGAPGAAPVPS